MNRLVSWAMVITLLVNVFALAFFVRPTQATATIYIRADGRVEGTTSIQTVDNVTYIFVANITGYVVVQRNNIVLDGNGCTLQGSEVVTAGINLFERSNVTVQHVRIQNCTEGFANGIHLDFSSNNTLFGNTIVANVLYGVTLSNSSNNVILDNNITDHTYYGICIEDSWGNYICGNTVSTCDWVGIGLYNSSANLILKNNATANYEGGIGLAYSSDNNVSQNKIEANGGGLMLYGSTNNTFSGNIMIENTRNFDVEDDFDAAYSSFVNHVDDSNTVDGKPVYYWIDKRNMTVPSNAGYVALINCTGITAQNLNLTHNSHGMLLVYTKNSTITASNLENNFLGIRLLLSDCNHISRNNVTDNFEFGIWLESSSNNRVTENRIANQTLGNGIVLYLSSNNSICGNNITNNYYGGIVIQESSDGNTVSGNSIVANNGTNGFGIDLSYFSSFNRVSENEITNDVVGISLGYSSGNSISGNNVTANGNCGVKLYSSSGNMLYHNSFINNTQQVSSDVSSINVWDDGYPSGGNYWSDHNGIDLKNGPSQNITGSDGIADTAYSIDANNRDSYPLTHPWSPPDVAVIGMIYWYEGQVTTHSGMVNIIITVKNNGNKVEAVCAKVYANNSVIGSRSFILLPQSTYDPTWTWNTAGYCGKFQISAYAEPLPGEIDTANNRRNGSYVNVVGKGCFIIVAGNCGGNLLTAINYGCNQVYKTLRSVGYSGNDICYMNQDSLGQQDVDGDGSGDIDLWSSSANLQWAIETWALSRANPTQPLFIYLFDHGGSDSFCIDAPDYVTSTQLASWIDNLQQATGAPVHVIYAACHSGSFIDELSKNGRVIITSCMQDENSQLGPAGTWEAFSIPFWNQIKSGHSLLSSFNYASSVVAPKWFWEYWWPTQTPLLDDNGDGIGHRGPMIKGSELFGFDGNLADVVYIGSCEWPYPYISQVMPRAYSTWPPSNVLLWAKVENRTSLSHVRAWMLPPDWSPSNLTNTLLSLNLECFEMSDIDHDGNWTVEVPAVNFTNHSSSLGNFTFFITAEEENGDMATPSLATVQFTETGEPPQDTVQPLIHIERPLEGSVVSGNFVLNGTALDDVCLDRVEIYIDDVLQGTVSIPPTSTSYFEFSLDTTIFQNGNRTILVKVYDKSGNSENESVPIFIENSVHDICIPNISLGKTVIAQGSTAQIEATVANHGSYTETFNLTLYANATSIITQLLTLPSQDYASLAFAWNTTGWAKGNYTISAYVEPVLDETETLNNNMTAGWAVVSIVGDVAGQGGYPDGKVDVRDVYAVGRAFGTSREGPNPPGRAYSPDYDVNDDGRIDIKDFYVICRNYGKTS
jgi:parallel beta-helix repeat protein